MYSYDFSSENTTFLTSKETIFNGRVIFNLLTGNDKAYQFIVKENSTTLFQTRKNMILYAPYDYTFRIDRVNQRVMSNLLSLLTIPITLVFDNSTKNITMNYTDIDRVISNDSICLDIFNGTWANTTMFSQCVNGTEGRMSFSVGQEQSVFVARVRATLAQDNQQYTLLQKIFDTKLGDVFGKEGLLATFFIVGIFFMALLFNPGIAIVGGGIALMVTSILSFNRFGYLETGVSMAVIVIAILIAAKLKI